MGVVQHILREIYGSRNGTRAFERILRLIEAFPAQKSEKNEFFSQDDIFLITYGDTLKKEGEVPLKTLYNFATRNFKGVFSTIHILPFFPFSSDDGFSVIDFFAVNPELGTWEDIHGLGCEFNLMFDLVLNHISSKSKWFQHWLEEKPGFKNLAIEVDPAADLSRVTRPRTLPLLTPFKKRSGDTVHVWTTFSSDQIDFNFKSIDVLEKMIETLLFYVEQGANAIRLDAIAYLWKEIGTPCIHLPQTHQMVQLFRGILDAVAPDVILITETNVPHDENISYFGDGCNEAQMVYNFTLPPLLFYSFAREDSTSLSKWARGLHLQSKNNTFFNFTASHDGIGVRSLEGILSKAEVDNLIHIVQKNGGSVSYKKNPDGSESPYELNITYVDALLNPDADEDSLHIQRFLASQAIQYALPGVPATYIHSVLGSRNWKAGVRQTQNVRTINREKLEVQKILSQLKNPETFRSRIFYNYIGLAKIRKQQPVFHPNAPFEILEIDPKVFGIKRSNQGEVIYALTNISSKNIAVSLPKGMAPLKMKDLISSKEYRSDLLRLGPYQYVWLKTLGS